MCKPVSRILFYSLIYLFSLPVLRFMKTRANNPVTNTVSQDLFGFSARKVFPPGQLLVRGVSSYLTFSPSPAAV